MFTLTFKSKRQPRKKGMFKVHQIAWVHSLEKGVSLQPLGRHAWLYSGCRERFLMLGSDGGWPDEETGKYIIPISFPKDTRYLPPYDDEPISAEERQDIKANVEEALSTLNADYRPKFTED